MKKIISNKDYLEKYLLDFDFVLIESNTIFVNNNIIDNKNLIKLFVEKIFYEPIELTLSLNNIVGYNPYSTESYYYRLTPQILKNGKLKNYKVLEL